MWDSDIINKRHQCEAYIAGEREGVSTTQAAESLNGAYRELGYRDGPMVEIAEKAVGREFNILRKHRDKFSKEIESGVGARIRDRLNQNMRYCPNLCNFDIQLRGRGIAIVTKTMGEEAAISHSVDLNIDGDTSTCDCNEFRFKGIPCEDVH